MYNNIPKKIMSSCDWPSNHLINGHCLPHICLHFVCVSLYGGYGSSLVYLDANSVDGQPQILREALVIVDILSLKESGGKGWALLQHLHVFELCLWRVHSLCVWCECMSCAWVSGVWCYKWESIYLHDELPWNVFCKFNEVYAYV